MLNSEILEKGLGIVSLPHFVYDFSRKVFFELLTDRISFSDCLICFPDCDVINFAVSLIFLIKAFFYMTKMSRQKLKYLENKKSF